MTPKELATLADPAAYAAVLKACRDGYTFDYVRPPFSKPYFAIWKAGTCVSKPAVLDMKTLEEAGCFEVRTQIIAISRKVVESGMFVIGPDGLVSDLPPHVIISITNPGQRQAALPSCSSMLSALRLQFWDTDKVSDGCFTMEQAADICRFVRKWLPEARLVVCQCEAGQSRSAGVAAALDKLINGSDDRFFAPPYTPNARVRSGVLRVWKHFDELAAPTDGELKEWGLRRHESGEIRHTT